MEIKPYEKNAKIHPEKQLKQIAASLRQFGWQQPIKVGQGGVIIAGHGRWLAWKKYPEGIKEPWVINESGETVMGESEKRILTIEEEKAYRLADNKLNESDIKIDLVIEELSDMSEELRELTGYGNELCDKKLYNEEIKKCLKDDFIIPPFSIWDTKQEYWQKRKKTWINFIGYSGTGRNDNLLGEGLKKLAQGAKENYSNETSLTGKSIFDPVVAEISYKWFCPESGKILDPFAGGHVRGSVAEICGFKYIGIDLSEGQIKSNLEQAQRLAISPCYICGNSSRLDELVTDNDFDFIFSCPPYFDLEKYNDGEGDLSMMREYADFLVEYKKIILKAVSKLKDNRFAVWVVGDVRNKDGFYYGFINDTVSAFREAGMNLYNEIILSNAIATAPMRARAPFENRKVTKIHQNVLCFFKGKTDMIKWYGKMPQIEKTHDKVCVFYKGNIDDIKKIYKDVETETVWMTN